MRFFSSTVVFAVAAASFIVPSLADSSFSQFSQRSDLFDARDAQLDARDYMYDLEARDYDELERRSYVVAPGSYVNSRDVLDELVARAVVSPPVIRSAGERLPTLVARDLVELLVRGEKPKNILTKDPGNHGNGKRDVMLIARDLVELLARGGEKGGADLSRSNAIKRPAGNSGKSSAASTSGSSQGGKSGGKAGAGAGGSKYVEQF